MSPTQYATSTHATTSPPSNMVGPQVTGYVDQHGERWVGVTYHGGRGFVRLTDLSAGRGAWDELTRQGVIVTTAATRNSIAHSAEAVDFTENLFVLDRNGWLGAHYVWPGVVAPVEVDGVPVVDTRPAQTVVFPPGGSFNVWKREMAALAGGQALPTFVLSCALAGLLCQWVDGVPDNPLYELNGDSSLGKSTLLALAASVLGRASEVGSTWSTTVNALEPTMARCADGLLVLDETGHFLSSADPGRARDYRNAVMKLAAGTSKQRLGEPAAAARRFVLLSSTNIPLERVLRAFTPDEAAATAVRLITIQADAGAGYGVFDRVPEGSSTSADAIARISRLAEEHYGWAGRAFVNCLEQRFASRGGRGRLRRMVVRGMTEFRVLAAPEELSSADGRVLDKFALVAIAGSLAARWGILPLNDINAAVLTVFGRRVVAPPPARAPLTARERVQAYYERHRPEVRDLRDGHYPDLSAAALDAVPGFLKREGNAAWLLVRSARWTAEFGGEAQSMLKDLQREGRLWVRDGLQSQHKVRTESSKDRFYRVAIDVERPLPHSSTLAARPAVPEGASSQRLQHDGDLPALRRLVAACGVEGGWRELDRGQQQFRGERGEVLNWWPTKGTITFQGRRPEWFTTRFARAQACASAPN